MKAPMKLLRSLRDLFQMISTVFTWEMDQTQSSCHLPIEIIGSTEILWSMLSGLKMDRCFTAIDTLKLQSSSKKWRQEKQSLSGLASYSPVLVWWKLLFTNSNQLSDTSANLKDSRKELRTQHFAIIKKRPMLCLKLITHSTSKSINLSKNLILRVSGMITLMANWSITFPLIQKLTDKLES